jgi:phenylpropionate dioxygenase-like ring-hydroxylating dioxygenase large terminal subunit
VFALEDRCAHRQLPLHMGVIRGEGIQCGYHGWCYDTCGKLVNIPYLADRREIPPEALGVRGYPCREAYGLVFVFAGALRKAETAPLPELPEFSSPQYRTMYFERTLDCHYTFMHENLMDMTHQFLHRRLMRGIEPVLLDYRSGPDWIEARYKFDGGKPHAGANFMVLGGKDETAVDRDYEIMTVRTDYPYQGLIVFRAHSETPAVRLWTSYVPLDEEQRRHRSFGLLMIRKPRIASLIYLAWPLIRYFAESIFGQDRAAVEAEQRAHDVQGADWNCEISPVLLELRKILARCGVAITRAGVGNASQPGRFETRSREPTPFR